MDAKISSQVQKKGKDEVKKKEKIFPFKCEYCGEMFIIQQNPKYLYSGFETLDKISDDIIAQTRHLAKEYHRLSTGYEGLVEHFQNYGTAFEALVKRAKRLAEDYSNISKNVVARPENPPRPPLPPSTTDFDDVVRLWGFICLKDNRYLYFGLTCPKPECKKTTICKYEWEEVKSELKQGLDTIYPSQEQYHTKGVKWFYIPFSISILFSLQQIKPSNHKDLLGLDNIADKDCAECINMNDDKFETIVDGDIIDIQDEHFIKLSRSRRFEYYIPSEYLPGSFPYRINSKDIDRLLKIENNDGMRYKVFPRVVLGNSIYLLLDQLNREPYGTDGTLIGYCQSLRQLLTRIVKNNREERKIREETRTWSYRDWVEDDLAIKQYRELNLEKINEGLLGQYVYGLRNEYIKKRNRIDFEVVYKKELINPYAKRLFGKKRKPNKRAERDKKMIYETAKTFEKEHSRMSRDEILDRVFKILKDEGKTLWTKNKTETYLRWIGEKFNVRKGRAPSDTKDSIPISETEPKTPAGDPAP